jgi:hypothetical protein
VIIVFAIKLVCAHPHYSDIMLSLRPESPNGGVPATLGEQGEFEALRAFLCLT